MKCESCGNELSGGAIICRVCNHNNALRSDWRAQRAAQQPAPRHNQAYQSRSAKPIAELPKIVPRKDADINLLRFPPASSKQPEVALAAPKPQTITGSETATTGYPPWRVELKERVRQIREKRNTGDLVAPSPSPIAPAGVNEAKLDRNPIVESALNRIRWSSHTPSGARTAGPTTADTKTARPTTTGPTTAELTTAGIVNQGARVTTKPPQPETAKERQKEGEKEKQREAGKEVQKAVETERQRMIPSVPPILNPSATPPPPPVPPPLFLGASRKPAQEPDRAPGRETSRGTAQETGKGWNPFALPAPKGPAPQTVNRPSNQVVNKADAKVSTERATQPLADKIDTKTLTPKTRREADPSPEPPPAPASKILTPLVKPRHTTELKTELRQEQRAPETPQQPPASQHSISGPLGSSSSVSAPSVSGPLDGKPLVSKPFGPAQGKHVETQVIEIAQAPEPLAPPEAEPASLWARMMAGTCDFEIVFTAYLPIFGAYAMLNDNNSFGGQSHRIMALLLSAVVLVYQTVTLMFAGRTSGMALLNLNLVNTEDESLPVTRRQKILRILASTVVFICFPLYLLAWLIPSRRSLPDLISGTTVAERRP